MKKSNSTLHQTSAKRPIFLFFVIMVVCLVAFGSAHPVILTVALLWLVIWLSITLSWGIHLDDHEVKDGYQVPWGPFITRRRVLFSNVGAVSRNGLGDVVIFCKSEFKYPGKKEVIISHNLKDFEVVVRKLLKEVNPSCMDENMKLFCEKA